MESTKLEPKQGEVVVVSTIPDCNFCQNGTPGPYDFATKQGPWANGCEAHWKEHRASADLGVGKGQLWITADQLEQPTETRYAVVSNARDAEQVARYLPSNYEIVGRSPVDRKEFVIAGHDSAGWTLDDYVIPRFASGLIWAREIDQSAPELRDQSVRGVTLDDLRLAVALQKAEESGDDIAVASALSDLCARLDLDSNETEQGLTKEAAERVDTFVSLVLIASENALSAEIECDLEERGLIVQTDQPYAEITEAGLAILLRRELS